MRKSEEGPGLALFMVGAIVGAVAALLLAPETGDDSRKRIGHWMHDHNPHVFEKLKKLLSMRHNGGSTHAVNGHTTARRHKGA